MPKRPLHKPYAPRPARRLEAAMRAAKRLGINPRDLEITAGADGSIRVRPIEKSVEEGDRLWIGSKLP
jgi:hypothetical protein